ncbi:hypothetical protein M378DRAFT_160113, partial [Amanita muscaria Koide BX008]
MKLTTAAVLAFAAASALANSVPYEETAVYVRNLYERDGGEGSLESFDKRGASSIFKSLADAIGRMGGRAASNAAQYGISRGMSPSTHATQSTPKHPPSLTHHRQRHRRPHQRQRTPQPPPQPPYLEERAMRRGLSRPIAHLESLEKRRRLPVARRALNENEPTTSRSSFAPIKTLKNAFTRTSQTTARVYRNSAPARKKGKGM